MLLSIDLSQIEIICFAFYCQDKTLCRLLQEGLDVHRYLAAITLNKAESEITDQERKATKAVSFGIIYGNGAFKLSQTLGIEQEQAKEYIEAFYETFPGAKTWHTRILKEVERNGYLVTPTNRLLKFPKFEAKFPWQKKDQLYYNPPDIKNWPVQSLAGDIYKLLLCDLYATYLKQNEDFHNNVKLINTIHDSIMFDCKDSYEQKCINLIQNTFDKAVNIIYTTYKIQFNVPIKYEISHGQSWDKLESLSTVNLIEENTK